MQSQRDWDEHARFMDALESERLVVLGGPLEDGPMHRALLVLEAPDEATARKRLADDPWMRDGTLHVAQVYRWELLLGRIE